MSQVSQSTEAVAFIDKISSLSQDTLDDVLQPSLEDEAQLRRLFATDKNNDRLKNPYVGLVDVFSAPEIIRTTRARVVKDNEDLSSQYIMPLADAQRRKTGAPSMSADLHEFKRNWSIFSENLLSQLSDWNNVVAAGGSVLACLTPLPEGAKASKRTIRKYFHSEAYPTSDVDLFLWGLSPEQAETKIISVYEAVRDSVTCDVTCVRTKHTVSIHSQYPYRSIQIVLRLYSSPAEILAGFDIDAPCCAYDGDRVWANPRAIIAMMRQCNTVDMTRRSPSYETRLSKYASRGFEVHVPHLRRQDVDPTIYERPFAYYEGLARLLVFEKLSEKNFIDGFLESRFRLRGRPSLIDMAPSSSLLSIRLPTRLLLRVKEKRTGNHKGDLKADTSIEGLEKNDYDITSLHIPYGPGVNARRIDHLVYWTDLGMNSTSNPKNEGRRLHRHPAFFGTMEECLNDCCGECPDPLHDGERETQAEEDKLYIRGRVSFIQDDPGRQSISGSFHPIDVGEWSQRAYIGETEKFFNAIAADDVPVVMQNIKQGVDVNRRDHINRTPLHFAIMTHRPAIACILIESGANMTARLVDGRTALHLAAQLNQLTVVNKLLERSALNAKRAERKLKKRNDDRKPDKDIGEENDDCSDGNSDEDDWSEGLGDNDKLTSTIAGVGTEVDNGDLPRIEGNTPDILDINVPDWDFAFTPLQYAVISGSLPIVEVLLAAGVGVSLVTPTASYGGLAIHPLTLAMLMDDKKQTRNITKSLLFASTTRGPALHPLTLAMLVDDNEQTRDITKRLLLAGATCSTIYANACTIFYRAVRYGNAAFVSLLLRFDASAQQALNLPYINPYASNPFDVGDSVVVTPLAAAVSFGNHAVAAVLLAHGAKFNISEQDISRAQVLVHGCSHSAQSLPAWVLTPLEAAVARHDDIAYLLVSLGANVNLLVNGPYEDVPSESPRKSLLEWTRAAIQQLSDLLATGVSETQPSLPEIDEGKWKGYHSKLLSELSKTQADQEANRVRVSRMREIPRFREIRDYFIEIESLLVANHAKTWGEILADSQSVPVGQNEFLADSDSIPAGPSRIHRDRTKAGFAYIPEDSRRQYVPQHLWMLYDELFEACFSGDNHKIQQLCLPTGVIEPGQDVLQITVQTVPAGKRFIAAGYSPLSAAVCGRHWDTARLIVAIALAQYVPEEKTKFNTKGISLGKFLLFSGIVPQAPETCSRNSDDKPEDTRSDVFDDGNTQQDAINFTDIAKRPSKVQCKVSPATMLSKCASDWFRADSSCSYRGNILMKSIVDDDLEAFVRIADLYESLPQYLPLDSAALDWIIENDRTTILDEYIRRTGADLDVAVERSATQSDSTNDTAEIVRPKANIYLGLSVHGKKRKDLAQKDDPNANQEDFQTTVPLLWKAIKSAALNIVDYLASDRPLAAYRFYVATHDDERAVFLRQIPDLSVVLPEWLGWKTSNGRESPLTAGVFSDNLEMLKKLFALSPQLLKSNLKDRIILIGFNPLMTAVYNNCKPEIFDFLLAKGVPPTEVDDHRGWNILHRLCQARNRALLEHVLRKLPIETIGILLSKQSKGLMETPLHVAVDRGSMRIVSLILATKKANLLLLDIDAQTPLHVAAKHGMPQITRLLLNEIPTEALHTENCIGETPLEVAIREELLWRTRVKFGADLGGLQHLRPEPAYSLKPYLDPHAATSILSDITKQRTEISKLKTTIDNLSAEGTLKPTTSLYKELCAFADRMEAKLATESAKPVQKSELPTIEPKEDMDREMTLRLIQEATSARPGVRQLVHLIDVQRSVYGNTPRKEEEIVADLRDRRLRGRVARAGKNDEKGPDERQDDMSERFRGSLMYAYGLLSGL